MSGPSILIVEDCEDLLKLETLMVERRCGGTVVPARSLAEVIERREQALVCNTALLDINLGEGQPCGVDVYYWLRANGFNRPIYFLTGHAKDSPLVVEATRTGDAQVLSKPINAATLIRILLGDSHGSHGKRNGPRECEA